MKLSLLPAAALSARLRSATLCMLPTLTPLKLRGVNVRSSVALSSFGFGVSALQLSSERRRMVLPCSASFVDARVCRTEGEAEGVLRKVLLGEEVGAVGGGNLVFVGEPAEDARLWIGGREANFTLGGSRAGSLL